MRLRRGLEIPDREIEVRASRSSGPGGQHANVTASRVEAVFDVAASRALDEEQKRRVTARLGPVVRAAAQDTRSQMRNRELAVERLRARLGPVVRATAQDTRSQARNRELAVERLRARLASALTVQRPRRATRPSSAARGKRMDAKRRRGEVKRARRRPEAE